MNSIQVDRWRQRAARARRERRPLYVSAAQLDELRSLGSITATIVQRRDDGTETAFGVPIEVR